jgi:hypothetical protein
MASPDGSTTGNVYPIQDAGINSYSVYPSNQGVMVQTIAYQIDPPTSTIDFILYYGGAIYIKCANGNWYEYTPATASGASFTSTSDPR